MIFTKEELEGCPYKPGDKFLLGHVEYWQDFAWWECDFGGRMVFELKYFVNGSAVLTAIGFGEKYAYGNGEIFLAPSYLNEEIKIGENAWQNIVRRLWLWWISRSYVRAFSEFRKRRLGRMRLYRRLGKK